MGGHINLANLDAKIAECNAAPSMMERRELFASFSMNWRPEVADPFSPEYRTEQMELYRRVAGKRYDLANEACSFDLSAATYRPYPYGSHDPEAVGVHLVAIGSLMRQLASVPVGGRILEFGPGWGNTTLQMALAGFKVTAVDLEEKFCELIRRRAIQHKVNINVVNSDFMYAETVKEPYDAVVFFECFHHCDDHMRLLRAMENAVKPGGKIFFGGEPIGAAFPIPWGLRLDGEALFAIRNNGWLELGFHERYFQGALRSIGWSAVLHKSEETFVANIWEARRSGEFRVDVSALDPKVGTIVGEKGPQGIVVEDSYKHWVFCGPFCDLPAGRWLGTVKLDKKVVSSGAGILQVCYGVPEKVIAQANVTLPAKEMQIRFGTEEAVADVQLRYFSSDLTSFVMTSIKIEPDESGLPLDVPAPPQGEEVDPAVDAAQQEAPPPITPLWRVLSRVFG
ncbi:MAG TPA: methyltransferase domain-containing protein [Ensifer sp.]|jgi:2-polyprenyl-3-methyl-5-hydroxy-6-metoxy-1,4-benzoquinol methylase|uniref:class I SAM-dependent methyltransferase n=1 Tax=Ensifer sp. TaxID=1872086 RepID=UPI002E10A7FE|nr:methyltransferase domain-containing protein [Ensifer sp.]